MLVSCAHGHAAPDEVIARLPICQGQGRHLCAVCAYAQGVEAALGKNFAGPMRECRPGHAGAPADMLDALPVSQAGPQRHRCVFLAFQEGANAELSAGDADAADRAALAKLSQRSDIGAAEKIQLMKARVGQGTFRQNAMRYSCRCRVTGTTDPRFLIASHIKPWRLSSDLEKLDGFNGLMLSPHVDHLFDQGWITFDPGGGLIMSPQLPAGLWPAWGLNKCAVTAPFTPGYVPYLQFHHAAMFKH